MSHRPAIIARYGGKVRLVAAPVAGSFLSLLLVGAMTWHFFPQSEQLLMMASFGSSAILIMTVPELITAQPWPAVMGHVVAALVGVFIRQNMPLPHFIGLALAVSLSLLLMFMTRSLHPPAGGTAIMALNVDGALADYGYWLALFPMAAGMFVLVAVSTLYLNFVAGRRYPRRQSYPTVSVDRDESDEN